MSSLTAASEAAVTAVTTGQTTPAPSGGTPSAPPAAPAAPAPPPPADTSTPPAATPPTPAPSGPAATPLDDQTVYMVDGVPKTGREIREGWLRQADYTRKAQEVAAQRQQLEQHRQAVQQVIAERQRLMQVFADPRVQSYLQQLQTGQAPQAPPAAAQAPQFDPNEIATVGQAQQVAAAQVARMQQQMAQFQQQMAQQLAEVKEQTLIEAQNAYEERTYRQALDPLVQRLVREDFPILAAVPEAESLLRFQALQRRPATLEDAQRVFQQEAKAIADKLQAHWAATMQRQQQASQQLAAQGIEPPGGAPPAQPVGPRNYQNADGTVNWRAMEQQAMQFVQSARPSGV